MKTKYILLAVLVLAVTALAQANPYPIYGATNPNSLVSIAGHSTVSDAQGNYQIELDSSFIGSSAVMSVNGCTTNVQFLSGPKLRVDYTCSNPPPPAPACPPATDLNVAIVTISTVITLAGAGYAFRIRKTKSGTVVKEHFHPGISTYHSIDTVHSDTATRHPKGCFDPVYKQDATGKWYFEKCASGQHK